MSEIFLYFWLESSVGVVKTEIYVPVIFFSRNKRFWKNIYYHNHFRFSDGNFPGLSQEISRRFISSAFDLSGENFRENQLQKTNSFSLFFFRFLRFSLFCEFTQILIGSVVRTELYVSTGLSSWEAFSLKKKFQIVFQFVGQSFSGFMAKRFLHGCQKCILCVQWNIPWRKVFWKILLLYMRKFGETF